MVHSSFAIELRRILFYLYENEEERHCPCPKKGQSEAIPLEEMKKLTVLLRDKP